MKYAQLRSMDISDGPGIRVGLYTQGCFHKCLNCFNPETWDFTGGKEWNEETNNRIMELMSKEYIEGLSILGGDPFCFYTPKYMNEHQGERDYLKDLLVMSKEKYPEKSIWLWTGYEWEYLVHKKNEKKKIYTPLVDKILDLLQYIDIVVDGPFIEEQKDWRLKYRGSRNQRLIHVKESLKKDSVVILDPEAFVHDDILSQ